MVSVPVVEPDADLSAVSGRWAEPVPGGCFVTLWWRQAAAGHHKLEGKHSRAVAGLALGSGAEAGWAGRCSARPSRRVPAGQPSVLTCPSQGLAFSRVAVVPLQGCVWLGFSERGCGVRVPPPRPLPGRFARSLQPPLGAGDPRLCKGLLPSHRTHLLKLFCCRFEW